jgi:ribosomal protein S5
VYDVKGVTVNVIAGTRKYSASGIGPITGITDVPSESRGVRLTLTINLCAAIIKALKYYTKLNYSPAHYAVIMLCPHHKAFCDTV